MQAAESSVGIESDKKQLIEEPASLTSQENEADPMPTPPEGPGNSARIKPSSGWHGILSNIQKRIFYYSSMFAGLRPLLGSVYHLPYY
eukprot:scaffold42675_cov34-Prasinocladus_malaysianus.AAC.3